MVCVGGRVYRSSTLGSQGGLSAVCRLLCWARGRRGRHTAAVPRQGANIKGNFYGAASAGGEMAVLTLRGAQEPLQHLQRFFLAIWPLFSYVRSEREGEGGQELTERERGGGIEEEEEEEEEEEDEGFKAKAVQEVEDEEEIRGGQVRHARVGALRWRRKRV